MGSCTHQGCLVSSSLGEMEQDQKNRSTGQSWDVCAGSCLGFPAIWGYPGTAVSARHGQRQWDKPEGVWKSARGKDMQSLPHSPPSASPAAAPSPQLQGLWPAASVAPISWGVWKKLMLELEAEKQQG